MKSRGNKKKLLVLLSLLIALSLIISACSSSGSSSKDKTNSETNTSAKNENSNDDSKKPAENQELNLTETSDIRSMDSSSPSDVLSRDMIRRLQSGLFSYHEDGELMPELAKKTPKVNNKKTEYTFKLRDAKWSDGSPITADQFVYGWHRSTDPDTKSEYADFFASAHIKNADKILDDKNEIYGKTKKLGVKAINKHTLKITLSKSTPEKYIESLLTNPVFFPLKKEFVEKQGKKYAKEPDNLLYSGPFKFKEWNHGEGWTIEKNKKYWNSSKVHLDKVNYKIVKDDKTALKLYNADKIDYTKLAAEDVDKYKNDGEFSAHSAANTYYWNLNYDRVPKFKNKNLRQALWLSMNRKGAADIILNDGSLPQNYFVPKNFAVGPDDKDFHAKGSPADLANYPSQNKEKAKELWKKAKDELGINKLHIELLTTDTEKGKDLAEYFVNQATKNLDGLSMSIDKVPFKAYLDRLDKGNCDICGGSGWAPDYEDPISFLEIYKTGNADNKLGFSDKKYDKILDKANKLGSQPKKRWKMLQKADKYLVENAAFIPEYQQGLSVLKKPYVKGFLIQENGVAPQEFYRYAKILKH